MLREFHNKGKIWTTLVLNNKEDSNLKQVVDSCGDKNWKKVSISLATSFCIARTPKQCRDRWINYVKTCNYPSKPLENEETQIFELFFEFGRKWSIISRKVQSKSENQIKNFINSTLRRNVRRYNEKRQPEERINCYSLDLFSVSEIRYILCANKSASRSWFQSLALEIETIQKIKEIELKTNRNLRDETSTYSIIRELDLTLDSACRNI